VALHRHLQPLRRPTGCVSEDPGALPELLTVWVQHRQALPGLGHIPFRQRHSTLPARPGAQCVPRVPRDYPQTQQQHLLRAATAALAEVAGAVSDRRHQTWVGTGRLPASTCPVLERPRPPPGTVRSAGRCPKPPHRQGRVSSRTAERAGSGATRRIRARGDLSYNGVSNVDRPAVRWNSWTRFAGEGYPLAHPARHLRQRP